MRRALFSAALAAALTLTAAPAFADHDGGDCDWQGDCRGQRYDQNYGSRDDRNRNQNRDRGAFSPGPFKDSPVDAFNGNTICLPMSTCNSDGKKDDRQPGEQQR